MRDTKSQILSEFLCTKTKSLLANKFDAPIYFFATISSRSEIFGREDKITVR